ncbi:MAG TPA: site-2 protease family protein, partial [Candidatus Absconditabacterales bacterium]|nr:site-2 protease family protein [Candidatus Absconditabacterales bacterium]
MIFSIITGVALFMFLVIIHELGHFFAAKKSGVKVLEFGVGIPPKICTLWTDKSGTEYTLNAIPLGGFVRLKGEDPTVTEDFHARDSFISANVVRKTIILLGGVTMNLLFAFFIFTLGFRLGVKPLFVVPENTFQSSVNSYLMPTLGFLEQKNFISGDIDKSQAQVFDILPDGLAAKVGL